MPYTIEQLTDLPAPAVLAKMSSPFETHKDVSQSLNDINEALAQIEGDLVYLIVDPTEADINMGDMIQGLAATFRPSDDVETEHIFSSRVRRLVIGTGTLMKLAANSARQDQYGNRPMTELFATLDEALETIAQTEKV